ncbi:MAG: riboflavin synthase [Chitinophagaceae bacterium]
MFTGIIEAMGTVASMHDHGTNKTFWINSEISSQLKVDQSLSHNGVCLTVEEVRLDAHRVTAVQETATKSNLGSWKLSDKINLERCLPMNGRLDGHMVQGHVDATGILLGKDDLQGSWQLSFSFPPAYSALIIEKGSICLNGISLTVFDVTPARFNVAIIPYTYLNTNLRHMKPGDTVNLEFDIIGKYVVRFMQLKE